jgi:hypothetical protein
MQMGPVCTSESCVKGGLEWVRLVAAREAERDGRRSGTGGGAGAGGGEGGTGGEGSGRRRLL